MQVKDTGLLLLTRYFSPFLKTGVTLTCLQSDGTSPLDREMLQKEARWGTNSYSFNIRAGISSGPFVFDGSRFFNTLCFDVYVWHVRVVVRRSWYFLSYVINSEHRVLLFNQDFCLFLLCRQSEYHLFFRGEKLQCCLFLCF